MGETSRILALVVLLGAVALDLVLGELPNAVHPVVLMGHFLRLGWRLRPLHGPRRQFLFGTAWVLLGLTLFSLPWILLVRAAPSYWWVWGIPMLKVTFAIRALLRAGGEVLEALERDDLDEARRRVRWHLVGRETASLPAPLVVSATVESLAENITDGLTGPLFWFALLGLPGAWAYRFANTADSMWGHPDPERRYVGRFAARLDDVLNWVPARLTAMLIVVAAGLVGEDPRGAWRTMWGQHRRTLSPNAGWTMSAMAGALGVTLEKVGQYRLEGGDGPLTLPTIRHALRAVRGTIALVVGLTALFLGVVYALA